jgi:hypothetical protein
MDIEKAREILESDIEKVYENDFANGVAIIAKYAKGSFNYNFEHDQMWFGDFEETVGQMTESEVRELAKYGWFEDEDGWSIFS